VTVFSPSASLLVIVDDEVADLIVDVDVDFVFVFPFMMAGYWMADG